MYFIKKTSSYLKKHQHFFWLSLIIVIGYMPIAAFLHPLKFDMIDQYYPWRFFISECIRNWELPLWIPYQRFGYPLHGEFASGVWYPITWIIGFIRTYDLYSLHFEFLIHIIFASFGTFLLAKTFNFCNKTSFLLGLAYAFSGIFIGNAQHITIIISAAWLPFIFNYFIKLLQKKQIKYVLWCLLFIFLSFSGGYFAILIITAYLLIIIFIAFLIQKFRTKQYKEIKQISLLALLLAIGLILINAVLFASIYYSLPLISRADALDLQTAMLFPFSPQCLISFIAPYTVVNHDMNFFNTDLSMSNGYFGIIFFIFFITSLFYKQSKLQLLFLFLGLLCLTAALGAYLPVRKLLYDYIPFMALFRFPSIFRVFSILFFLIVAGNAFDKIFEENNDGIRIHKTTFFIGLLLIATTLLLLFLTSEFHFLNFTKSSLFTFSQSSNISEHLIFQLIFQFIIIGSALLILIFLQNKLKYYLLLLLIAVDLIFAANLNAPYTLYSKEFKFNEIHQHTQKYIKGFPVPSFDKLKSFDNSQYNYKCFWLNQNIFYKTPGYDGYDSYVLKSYDNLRDSFPIFFNHIIDHPICYFADTIVDLNIIKKDSLMQKHYKIAGVSAENYEKTKWPKSYTNNIDTIIIEKFNPTNIKIWTRTNCEKYIVLLQSWSPGWKLYINNCETQITKTNINFIGFSLPKGDSSIQLVYTPTLVKACFYISLISLLVLLSLLIFYEFIDKRIKYKNEL